MKTRASRIKTSAVAGTLLVVLTFVAALTSVQTMASDEVQREHRIDATDITRVVIENSVGSVVLQPSPDSAIHVSVLIEGKRHGMLRRKLDVSEVDIALSRQGTASSELRLALNEDHVQGRWVAALPQLAEVHVNQGVGSLEVSQIDASLTLEVGVGNIELRLASGSVGRFAAEVGVGGISQQGLANYSSRRAVVTESSTGQGSGDHAISADVGVGDIDIRLLD